MTKNLLLLVLVSCVVALTPRPKHVPRHIFGRPYGGFMNRVDFSPSEDAAVPFDCDQSSYFEGYAIQPVDHFANTSSTWLQFYQYNSKFYNGSSNLVFFMLGGESPIGSKWVCKDAVTYLTWAKKYGAAVFQAEHRYFGRSRPAPTQTVANLKWFTPEQILADYNSFIAQMNVKYFDGKPMRWVLFGGSYPGSLTAWMRVAYPNASIGGVSSSSAVNLWVDYYGYATNMQKNYNRTSATCASNIGAAFKKIQSMSFSEAGRAQLKQIFNLCSDFPSSDTLGPKDLQFFWSNIFGEFQGLNQYSGDNRDNLTANGLGVPKACDIMNDASEPNLVVRVQNVINWVNTMYGEPGACMPNSYGDYMAEMSNATYDQTGDIAAGRSWMYQCCSYLGYFQTTDGGHDNGIWGSLLPVDFYVDQCIDMFSPQFKLDYTYAQVEKYREMFGAAKHYKGSKCVFPNGNMDPWFSLGLIQGEENQANQVFATTIDMGAHCSDMYPARAQDSASLTAARAFIASKLDSFIRSG